MDSGTVQIATTETTKLKAFPLIFRPHFCTLLFVLATVALPLALIAQTFPNKPIRLLLPYGAGALGTLQIVSSYRR